MPHNVRVQPDTVWRRGYVPKGTDLSAIDANTVAAVNGDGGSSHAPTAPIFIGGAGLIAAAPWSGFIDVNVSSSGPLVFGKGTADDAIGLGASHVGRTASIMTSLQEAYGEYVSAVPLGAQIIARGAGLLAPIRVFNGGTIFNASVRFLVGETHAAIPDQLPRYRVIAVDANGAVYPMTSKLLGGDASGFYTHGPVGAPANWAPSVGVQQDGIYFDQNNVVDTSRFSYFIEILEEDGTGAWSTTPNTWVSVTLNMTGIALLDGRA